jgi:hypothetical protein
MSTHRLHLIVSEQLHQRLKRVVKEEFVTVSEYARRAIIHRLWQDVKRNQSLASLVRSAFLRINSWSYSNVSKTIPRLGT